MYTGTPGRQDKQAMQTRHCRIKQGRGLVSSHLAPQPHESFYCLSGLSLANSMVTLPLVLVVKVVLVMLLPLLLLVLSLGSDVPNYIYAHPCSLGPGVYNFGYIGSLSTLPSEFCINTMKVTGDSHRGQ